MKARKNPVHEVYELGQSIWYDNIQRRLIEDGQLENMIANGDMWGITSNPSIFQNAISRSNDYDDALMPLSWAGWDAERVYEKLAIEDISAAADLFADVYTSTQKKDGYVSIEVNPLLAHKTDETIKEAARLWQLINRPNLMIKIPATPQGIPAIRETIALGINVNVTLIFSLDRYIEVMNAYMEGLESRIQKGLPINHIASVASFFVSRLDTKIDAKLEKIIQSQPELAKKASALLGKIAIASSRIVYETFQESVSSARFQHLLRFGAQIQRPLWASTSTKNPNYRDVMYVEELIAPDTVNTVPPATLMAFKDHGKTFSRLQGHEKEAHAQLEELDFLGISLKQITEELEYEGVKAFADAYTGLISSIDVRIKNNRKGFSSLLNNISNRVSSFEKQELLTRFFRKDSSLWSDIPQEMDEIAHRLGWLEAPEKSREKINEFNKIRDDCLQSGFTHAVLIGMGGSSLSAEVLSHVFEAYPDARGNGLHLRILDSTHPDQVQTTLSESPLETTLFIISSKSGTTSEVMANFSFFWDRAVEKFGDNAGEHFAAITDPNTKLEKLAKQLGFRAIVTADPDVGGRYSALIEFGLLPACLMGIDVSVLLSHSSRIKKQCQITNPLARNPGEMLGIVLAEAMLNHKDKLTILSDAPFQSFGSWLEQLIAESTGKNGKGIVPIDLEPIMTTTDYGGDRIFIYFRSSGDNDKFVEELRQRENPVLTFEINDPYTLGKEFFRWEFATAVACAIIGVNAFDQPDVQDNKSRTEGWLKVYKENPHATQEKQPLWQNNQVSLYSNQPITIKEMGHQSLTEIIEKIKQQVHEGDYISINAFVPRNEIYSRKLQHLRRMLSRQGSSTTLGFGPRFLHSTGQLHKGGPNSGVFVMITEEIEDTTSIPELGIDFRTLLKAQAIGDYEALIERKRRVFHLHFKEKFLPGIEEGGNHV